MNRCKHSKNLKILKKFLHDIFWLYPFHSPKSSQILPSPHSLNFILSVFATGAISVSLCLYVSLQNKNQNKEKKESKKDFQQYQGKI